MQGGRMNANTILLWGAAAVAAWFFLFREAKDTAGTVVAFTPVTDPFGAATPGSVRPPPP